MPIFSYRMNFVRALRFYEPNNIIAEKLTQLSFNLAAKFVYVSK